MTTKTATPTRRAAAAARATSSPEGIVKAIVAVTGTVDEVNDLIMPGSFTVTLTKRRPKVVFHHDFRDFVGRVLHVEEWAPGDARLPKKTPMGAPWPAEAGALVATMQFNMATERGREVFEWVRFYHAASEAAWSIGYKVQPGMARKRHDGVRVIFGIDLYELSVVLHGAHTLATTLETKTAGLDRLEVKGSALARAIVTDLLRASTEAKSAAAVVLEAKGLAAPPVPPALDDLEVKMPCPVHSCTCGDAGASTVDVPVEARLSEVAALINGGPLEGKALTAELALPLTELFDALGGKGVDVAGVMLDPTLASLHDGEDDDEFAEHAGNPAAMRGSTETKGDRDPDEAADLLGTRDVDTRPGADVNPRPGDLYKPSAADPVDEDLDVDLMDRKVAVDDDQVVEPVVDDLEAKGSVDEGGAVHDALDIDADPDPEPDDDLEGKGDVVLLDPEFVRAQLAALSL